MCGAIPPLSTSTHGMVFNHVQGTSSWRGTCLSTVILHSPLPPRKCWDSILKQATTTISTPLRIHH